MKPLLEVFHLVKHYDTVKAVDGITFFIEPGQVFGLLGPNGAGKTTTINILAQILPYESGKIEIDGMNLNDDGFKIKEIVGYVPQDIALYEGLTGKENLRFFGGLYGLSGKELHDRVDNSLDLVGLQEAGNRRSGTYSGGMKRRLNIAAGLLNNPRLLILDEPAVGVDPQSRNHILNSIQELNEEHNISVLYTSHYMEEVQQICDRVAIIDHGKIIADNNIDDLIRMFGSGMITVQLDKEAQLAVGHLPDELASDQVQTDGNILRVQHKHPQRMLPNIIDSMNSVGLKAIEIEIVQSNLEAVFLNLTGRSLRDE